MIANEVPTAIKQRTNAIMTNINFFISFKSSPKTKEVCCLAVAIQQTITTVTVQAQVAQQHAPTMVVEQLPTTTTNMAEA